MWVEWEWEVCSYCVCGNELVEGIKVVVDCECIEIIVGVYCQVEELCGVGDVEVVIIYVKVYNKDFDFFVFFRFMDVYWGVFSSKDDLILVSLEGEFFEYMKKE